MRAGLHGVIGCGGGSFAALFGQFGGDNPRRTHDAVANHHHSNGCACYDGRGRCTRLRRVFGGIHADVAVDESVHFGARDANQQNRLVVFQHFRALDGAFVIQRHNGVNRFAGIAARADHVCCDVHHAHFFVAFIHFCHHRLACGCAKACGIGENIGRLDFVD